MPVEKIHMAYSNANAGLWCFCPFCNAKILDVDPGSESKSTTCEHFRGIEDVKVAIFYLKESV